MAIPFTIPGHQQVSPERLQELCDFLQQLLIVCQQNQAILAEAQAHNRASVPMNCEGRILSTLSAAIHTNNHRIRRQRLKRTDSNYPEQQSNDATPPNVNTEESQNQRWKRVGTELRKIADEFESAAYENVDGGDVVDSPLPCPASSSRQRSTLLSKLLHRPSIIKSLCTVVICAVGWHLLRNR